MAMVWGDAMAWSSKLHWARSHWADATDLAGGEAQDGLLSPFQLLLLLPDLARQLLLLQIPCQHLRRRLLW